MSPNLVYLKAYMRGYKLDLGRHKGVAFSIEGEEKR